MTDEKKHEEELSDEQLDDVSGGAKIRQRDFRLNIFRDGQWYDPDGAEIDPPKGAEGRLAGESRDDTIPF